MGQIKDRNSFKIITINVLPYDNSALALFQNVANGSENDKNPIRLRSNISNKKKVTVHSHVFNDRLFTFSGVVPDIT